MGSWYSKLNTPFEACAGSVAEIITGRKRKREDETDESSDNFNSILERSLNTPKKKKLLSTTQYIYQALYKESRNSDISVMALGKIWQLHKVYLCQSPYFASMFGGSWRETQQNFVNIEIIDDKINLDALEIVFGSLYLDEVIIEPKCVTSVLATATLFQLDGLIDRCAEVMTETVNAGTAIEYYETAHEYGVQSVKNSTFNWLLVNLLSFYSKHNKWLKKITPELMERLVSSPDLFVIQTEFSLYLLLRHWLFLKLHPDFNEVDKKKPIPLKYFANLKEKVSFLYTKEGQKYEKPFRRLRIPHLLNHPIDLNLILEDNLIPRSWLHDPLLLQWNSMLKIDQATDCGPTSSSSSSSSSSSLQQCDKQSFYQNCIRCGRILQESGFQKWRWTGFNFGLDLVLITDSRTLRIKRHHRTEPERLLSLQNKRSIQIRVTISSVNEQRQVIHSQSTDIKSLTLDKNEECPLMVLDHKLEYPLYISVNMLVISPMKIQYLLLEETEQQNQHLNNKTPISNIGSISLSCIGTGSGTSTSPSTGTGSDREEPTTSNADTTNRSSSSNICHEILRAGGSGNGGSSGGGSGSGGGGGGGGGESDAGPSSLS